MEADLQAAAFMTLAFKTKKNVIKGEKIGHKASGDPLLCPKATLLWSVIHLRDNKAPPSTPLACVMTTEGIRKNITPITI